MSVELLTVFYVAFKKQDRTYCSKYTVYKRPNFGLTIFLKLLVFGIGEKRFSSIKFTFKI